MACHCVLGTSFFPPLPLHNSPRTRTTSKHSLHPISSQFKTSETEEESKPKRNPLDILSLSVTLTVVSASLPKQSAAAAKVSERKPSAKKAEALTAEELKSWAQELPTVTKRMPYSEILDLQREGKLKHVVRSSGGGLRDTPEVVLAVLEDSSVFRIVLPSIGTDAMFWLTWDALGIDSVCVIGYTPPVKKPEIPSPYFVSASLRLAEGFGSASLRLAEGVGSASLRLAEGFGSASLRLAEGFGNASLRLTDGLMTVVDLARVDFSWVDLAWVDLSWLDFSWLDLSWVDLPRVDLSWVDLSRVDLSFLFLNQPKPQSKKALEAKRMREELRRNKDELVRMREEKEMMEKAMRAKKKIEDRKRMREMKKKHEKAVRLVRKNYEEMREMGNVWDTLARDQTVQVVLGFFFFYIFYRTVVVSYKKQKKDYEDRLKIEMEEAEERRKMKDLDREMMGFEGEEDEEAEGKGEQNPYMKTAKQFMKSGARVRRVNSKRLPKYLEDDVDVKFSDVAGLGKIRLELEEIVKFFTHGEMYRRRGVKIPGGILLCGPPGVGKTLLAKAVAGEAGVNFFSISASQFVEIYVGVGASRVRALYQEARENAPSVVYIDELDAVGRERGLIKGSGGQERDATLNQLLVCLDGFEGRGEVITIASTNRPDILDPALVRPGRFDRKIHIPRPGLKGRVEILKVHARKKQMAEDVDYMAVAGRTNGMVGAELANIIEVAAINIMRDGRTEITTDDLLQAAEIEDRGMLDRKERSPEMWKQIAINEAAMAVVAVNFPDLRNIEFVNIAPRAGREFGYVRAKMDDVKFSSGMLSRQSVLDYITVQLAPRAADEIWHGEGQLSTIWAKTADNARSAARSFILGGLSEKHYGMSDFWVADRLNGIDEEALQILNTCYELAKEILQKNRELMDAVVNELVEKKRLNKQDFFRFVELYGSLQPMPPSILDIRNAKRLQFQDMMMNQKQAAVQSNS